MRRRVGATRVLQGWGEILPLLQQSIHHLHHRRPPPAADRHDTSHFTAQTHHHHSVTTTPLLRSGSWESLAMRGAMSPAQGHLRRVTSTPSPLHDTWGCWLSWWVGGRREMTGRKGLFFFLVFHHYTTTNSGNPMYFFPHHPVTTTYHPGHYTMHRLGEIQQNVCVCLSLSLSSSPSSMCRHWLPWRPARRSAEWKWNEWTRKLNPSRVYWYKCIISWQ